MRSDPGTTPDDGALVRRARRGDSRAFEELVRRHYRSAYGIALGRLGAAMDAEDVVQEAFVKALEQLDACRKPQRFRAWLLTIVRNMSLNRREYLELRTPVEVETDTLGHRADPEADAVRSELREELEGALMQLAETKRQVVLLHDLDGWKHREIAEILGISVGMSRYHLMEARRALRATLGAERLREQGIG